MEDELAELAPFDFALPAEAIAQQPLAERDAARLLVLQADSLGPNAAETTAHHRVRELPQLLRAGDLLVLNRTRVLPAKLRGCKSSGGRAEALLLGPADGPRRYRALLRVGGRLREGLALRFAAAGGDGASLRARVAAVGDAGQVELEFESDTSPYSVGEPPLPPYIPRAPGDGAERSEDRERYQTVFAREPGAVAAPTAGLHLTTSLLGALERAGIEVAELVLHVGLGTFKPLRAEDLERGRLHLERFALPSETAEAVARTRARGGRVVAVGTTSTRVLETRALEGGLVDPGEGETDLFLRSADAFRVVDLLLTNFHLPRSSLLMLVCAFAGRKRVLDAYAEALRNGYRFYSYGDAMLLERATTAAR